jgi:hypothetical protein
MNNDSLPSAGPGSGSARPPALRRATVRRELAACWGPLWEAVEALMPLTVEQAVVRRGLDDDAAAAAADALAGREQAVVQSMRDTLRVEFDAALDKYVAPQAAPAPTPTSGTIALSLVDFDDMEFDTLVDRAAARIRNANDEQYSMLRLRVAGMSGEVDLRDVEFPFRPAVFYRAVHGALDRAGVAPAACLNVLARFDRPVAALVAAAYRALDKHLNTRGHAHNLPFPGAARNTVIRRLGRQSTHFVPDRSDDSAGTGHSESLSIGSSAHAEQILQALYQRLQLSSTPMMPTTGVPAAPFAGGVANSSLMPNTLTWAPGGMPLAGMPTMAAFGSLGSAGPTAGQATQPGGGMPPFAPTTAMPTYVDSALIGAIHNIQRLSAMALSAADGGGKAPDAAVDVAELRDKLSERATRQVDKLTIEIVGLLFERIERDRYVPREIKELLQRLQFPIIKAALTDPEIFVAQDRAPRLLIDRIAATAVGWQPDGQDNKRYLAQVQSAVGTVLSSVEEGLGAFQRALADFEAYLAEERAGDDDPVARAKSALAEAETREIMAINATVKIRGAFDNVRLEAYLREFLLETWVRVLVAAWIKDASEEPHMQKYLGIVPDLVWSVQPKIDPADRKRLVLTIPTVLGALREGLLLIDWPVERTQEFFSRLIQSHTHAVRALEMAHGLVSPIVESQTIRAKLKDLRMSADEEAPKGGQPIRVSDEVVRQVLAARQVDVDHLETPPADTAATDSDVSDAELDQLIAGWRRGDWFTLRLGAVSERVQLRWISPRCTLFLFTPADGQRSHSLAPEAIRARLRSGDLLPVESAPLFERAVQGLMARLENAADGVAAGAG